MSSRSAPPIALALLLAGCMVHPDGEDAERERAAAAGVAWQQAFAERELPPLPPDAPLSAYLAHAERANGALEAAFERWQAALQAVPQAGMQTANAMFGVEHMLDGGDALERTTVSLMNEAMNSLVLPGKLRARGEAALAQARVAAADFDRQRLQLQAEVAERYLQLALRDADLGLLQQLRAVLAMALPSAEARVRAGAAGQGELLQAQIALDRVDAELQALQQGRPALLAALRAAVGSGPDLVDAAPPLPALQPLRAAETEHIGAVLLRNPELQAARAEAEAALRQLHLAEWQRVPDFSLSGLLTGGGVVTLGAAVSLPFLRDAAISAAIAEAAANHRAAVALQRQAGSDAIAAVLAQRAELQAAEQQAAVLQQRLLPRLRQQAAIARASWTAGSGGFAACSEAMAMAVEVERALARLSAEHASGRARLAARLGELQLGSPPAVR